MANGVADLFPPLELAALGVTRTEVERIHPLGAAEGTFVWCVHYDDETSEPLALPLERFLKDEPGLDPNDKESYLEPDDAEGIVRAIATRRLKARWN